MQLKRRTVEVGGIPVTVYYDECTYPPLDDSLLGAEMLVRLYERGFRFGSVLDIGTGSGVLAKYAYTLFRPRRLAATDISPYAVRSARLTLDGTGATVFRCDIAECLEGKWDLIVSNPPYLPATDSTGACEGYEELQWSSGSVLARLCDTITRLARSTIVVYSSLSPLDIGGCLAGRGFRVRDRLERRYFMEAIIAVYAERAGGAGGWRS